MSTRTFHETELVDSPVENFEDGNYLTKPEIQFRKEITEKTRGAVEEIMEIPESFCGPETTIDMPYPFPYPNGHQFKILFDLCRMAKSEKRAETLFVLYLDYLQRCYKEYFCKYGLDIAKRIKKLKET